MAFDINDPADKKILDDAVKAAVEDAKGPLDKKNRELLDELKEARKGRTIDPAELEKLEGKVEELQGKLTGAEKAAKDAVKAAETATKALEAESGVTHRLVAENGLVKVLTEAGITDPAYLEAAKAMHMGAVRVVAEGDGRKAMYGDKDLGEAVKEWAASDVGKKFVSAPNNGGGGAGGGAGGGGGKNPFAKESFNMTEQARLYRENPTQAAELAKSAGVDIAA